MKKKMKNGTGEDRSKGCTFNKYTNKNNALYSSIQPDESGPNIVEAQFQAMSHNGLPNQEKYNFGFALRQILPQIK